MTLDVNRGDADKGISRDELEDAEAMCLEVLYAYDN